METLNTNKEHNSILNTSVHLNTQSGNYTLKFSWLNIGEEYRTNSLFKNLVKEQENLNNYN